MEVVMRWERGDTTTTAGTKNFRTLGCRTVRSRARQFCASTMFRREVDGDFLSNLKIVTSDLREAAHHVAEHRQHRNRRCKHRKRPFEPREATHLSLLDVPLSMDHPAQHRALYPGNASSPVVYGRAEPATLPMAARLEPTGCHLCPKHTRVMLSRAISHAPMRATASFCGKASLRSISMQRITPLSLRQPLGQQVRLPLMLAPIAVAFRLLNCLHHRYSQVY